MIERGFAYRACLCAVLAMIVATAGCQDIARIFNKEEAPAPAPAVQAEEGWQYYVGGPIMRNDPHGRLRLGGFNGEVKKPTNRGLLIGVKHGPEDAFEFATWVNGVEMNRSEGIVKDGIYFFTKRRMFNADHKVITTLDYEYDDEAKTETVTQSRLDPDTGEVLDSSSASRPYQAEDDVADDPFFAEGQEPAGDGDSKE